MFLATGICVGYGQLQIIEKKNNWSWATTLHKYGREVDTSMKVTLSFHNAEYRHATTHQNVSCKILNTSASEMLDTL